MSENGIFRAEQRVKEMNRMAQQYVRQGNNYINSNGQRQPRFEPVQKPEQPAVKPAVPQDKPVQQKQPSHQQFSLDNEKLLILLIMYLLIREKGDIKLIAALGYLLL